MKYQTLIEQLSSDIKILVVKAKQLDEYKLHGELRDRLNDLEGGLKPSIDIHVIVNNKIIVACTLIDHKLSNYETKLYSKLKVNPKVFVREFWVHPQFRGLGLGKQIIAFIVKSFSNIALSTDNTGENTNESAIHLYEKMGFRRVKVEKASTYWYKE